MVIVQEEDAIEEEIMRVFAQNEQRQRKARQYLNLYERRDKERVERLVKEVMFSQNKRDRRLWRVLRYIENG